MSNYTTTGLTSSLIINPSNLQHEAGFVLRGFSDAEGGNFGG